MSITATANAQLTLDKMPNYSYAAIGTNMTFSLTVNNTGDVNLDNVIVFDQLDSNLKFIQGSVAVNGNLRPEDSVISGINLGTIKPGEIYRISFDVTILSSPPGGIVYNTANAQYSYIPSPGSPSTLGSNTSDTIEIGISDVALSLVKTANVTNASLGDTITYNIKLVNTGNVEIVNVALVDTLPNGITLVPRTFKVNGKVVNSVDLTNVFVAHSIPVGGVVDISFDTVVTSIDCGCNVANTAIAKYKYTLPSGVRGVGQTSQSSDSTVAISMNISNFKQFSIEEYLEIPCQKPDLEDINDVMGTVEIVKCMVIQTSPITSVEGQSLTGYKLIVHGILRLTVEYTACEETQSVHSATYSIPFSSFIILPANFVPGTKVNVDAEIEDIYFNSSSCRLFFTNTTLLIKACTVSCR